MNPTLIQVLGAVLFAIAVLHTFSTRIFERLAHSQPRHAGLWHLLGEVEVVFGFWAMVLVVCMFAVGGKQEATAYLDSRNYTEPMFVFVIMVIAGTRAVLQFAAALVRAVAAVLPLPRGMGMYFLTLALVPLLGSFITEPAAMTLAALMLRDTLFARPVSRALKYTTVGVLFVNISIGGTLTPFAAPPVLMVASTWNWDLWFMLSNFGWKAAIAVLVGLGVAVVLVVATVGWGVRTFQRENAWGCNWTTSKTSWSSVVDTQLYDADAPPGLEVKTGSTVTFTYIVKNTGDTALKDVKLVDDRILTVNYVSGDTDNDGILDGADKCPLTAAATPVNASGTNTATSTKAVAMIGPTTSDMALRAASWAFKP